MKRFIRTICLILVAVCLFTTTAYAAEITESRASNYFWRTSAYLDLVSGRTFEIWFDVEAVDIMDELGVKTIKVQRSSNGSSWSTMATYTKADYSQMMDYNSAGHADCITYTGTAGYYYRALVTFYAKNSSGSSTYDTYTAKLYLNPSN